MTANRSISIIEPQETALNGMGQMIRQYLEQNLEDFPGKAEQARRLRCSVSVEVERGIASTIRFEGETIRFENGIAEGSDFWLKSSYHTLAKVLSGQVNPMGAILKGQIKIMRMSRHPVQAVRTLRFLKIPPALLITATIASKKKKRGRTISFLVILTILLLLAFFLY
jgi:putative sterol carrier protein